MKKVYLIAAALLTSSSLQQGVWGVPLTPEELNRLRTYATAANTMRTDVHGYDPQIARSTTDLKILFPKIYPQTQLPPDPKNMLLGAAGTQSLSTTIEQRWNANLNNGFAASQQDLWSMAIAARQANGWDISLLAAGATPTNNHLSAFYNNAFISLMESINRTLLQNREITTSLAPPPAIPLNAAEDANDPVLQSALRASQRLADEARAQEQPAASGASTPSTQQEEQLRQAQALKKQQEAAEKRQRQQELAWFNQFLTESNSGQVFRDELIPLTHRNNPEFHAEWDRFFQRYEDDFRLQPASRNTTIRTSSQEFRKAFWDYAIRVISQERALTWRNAYAFKSWYRLANYMTWMGAANPEGIHALDPLVQNILPQMFGCVIDQTNMDQPGDRQAAERVSNTFMEWIHQSGLDEAVILNAVSNVTGQFLRPKGQDGILSQELNPNRTHWQPSTFEYKKKTDTSYNAYQRIDDDEEEAFYPSLGLRLQWQAGFLTQAEALIRFVDSIPNDAVKRNLKRNLVKAFSEALELDGLCLIGNWTRWFEAILKLGYTYIDPDNAQTDTDEEDLTWLTSMRHYEIPRSVQTETPRTQSWTGSLTTTTTSDALYEEFKALVELYHPDREIPFDSQKPAIIGYMLGYPDGITAQELLSHEYPMRNCLGLSPIDNDEDAGSESGSDTGSDNDEDEDSEEETAQSREEVWQEIAFSFQQEAEYEHLRDIDRILAADPEIDGFFGGFTNPRADELLSYAYFKTLCNKRLRSSVSSGSSTLRTTPTAAPASASASRPTEHRTPARSPSPAQRLLDVGALRSKFSTATASYINTLRAQIETLRTQAEAEEASASRYGMNAMNATSYNMVAYNNSRIAASRAAELREKISAGNRHIQSLSSSTPSIVSVAQTLFPVFRGNLDYLANTLITIDPQTLRNLIPHLQQLFPYLTPSSVSSDNARVRLIAGLAKAAEPNRLGEAITHATGYVPFNATDDTKVAILNIIVKNLCLLGRV